MTTTQVTTADLGIMSIAEFREDITSAITQMISVPPGHAGVIDLAGVRISYYTNTSFWIETGAA